MFGLSAFIFLLVRLIRASVLGYGGSIVRSPLPLAFMKVLHASLVIFIVDQIKIDYLRNEIYMYFVWFFFGLITATHSIIVNMERAERTPGRPSRR